MTALGPRGIGSLVAGGQACAFGVIFYAFGRIPFNQATWQVFVIAGSLCHYLAVS